MPANRSTTLPAIWASTGVDLPVSGSPVQGTTYTDSGLAAADVNPGWPFATIANSSIFNEVMKRCTALLQSLEQYGILPWCPSTTYKEFGKCMGSDGNIYRAVQDSTGYDPMTSSSSYWVLDNFEAGTKMVFVQASVPSGWTLDTTATYHTAGLRIVTSVGGGVGGSSDAFSSHNHTIIAHTHGNTFSVSSHVLTVDEIPAHRHPIINDGGVGSTVERFFYGDPGNGSYQSTNYTSAAGGGIGHTHGFTGSVSSGGAGTSGTFSPKYINAIVGIKG